MNVRRHGEDIRGLARPMPAPGAPVPLSFAQIKARVLARAEFPRDKTCGDGLTTGSIADDVTEIYFALKRGLDLWPLDEEHALREWVASYEDHWRRHLVNLMAQAKIKVRYH